MAKALLSRHFSTVLSRQSTLTPTRPSVRHFSADHHHGPPKINFWEDPMSPSKWKEEHFVLISLAGWGLFAYGVIKGIGALTSKPPSKDQVQAHHQ